MLLADLPEPVRSTLERLHADADRDLPRIARGFARSLGGALSPHHMRDAYIAVGRDQGGWLHDRVIEADARNIVEFGASFGISALWLGAAAARTGGRVVTTEIEPAKIEVARRNIAQAGLDGVVTLLAGDAVETLRDHPGPVDLLYFDGWTERYLPLLELLEPRLAPGCPLLVDNASSPATRRFLRAPADRPGWTTLPPWGRRVAQARWTTPA